MFLLPEALIFPGHICTLPTPVFCAHSRFSVNKDVSDSIQNSSRLMQSFLQQIHQWRARRGTRDALHHQQQALLRNSHSVAQTLWLWWTIGWAWRSKSNNSIMRSLALIVVAITQITIFLCAGIFSSAVVLTDNEVLASAFNKSCGLWHPEAEYRDISHVTRESLQKQITYGVNARKEISDSLGYVAGCYDEGDVCTGYINTALALNKDYTVKSNASCPFDDDLCATEAVHIDTGMFVSRSTNSIF